MTETAHIEQDITQIKTDLTALREDVDELKQNVTILNTKSESFATKAEVEKMGRTIIMWLTGIIIGCTSILAGIIIRVIR